MRIIEIQALENGAHRNQETNDFFILPEGWAIIPNGMELANFPFGNIEVKEVAGKMFLTSWEPLEIEVKEDEEA